MLKDNPNITDIRGHSLGSSVALELQKNYTERNLKTRVYNSPVWDIFGQDKENYDKWVAMGKPNLIDNYVPEKPERYRNLTDPVSFFDSGATNYVNTTPFSSKSLSHDYSNIAKNFKSAPQENKYEGWVSGGENVQSITSQQPPQPLQLESNNNEWVGVNLNK